MSGRIRSRRAGIPREAAKLRPLYARILGLQYLSPSGFLCFAFFEGAIALGTLLALAELVSWWGVLVLPVTVALMVKLNDVVAGALTPTASHAAAGPGVSRVRAGVSRSGSGVVVHPVRDGGPASTARGHGTPGHPAAGGAVERGPGAGVVGRARPSGAGDPGGFADAPDDPRVFGVPDPAPDPARPGGRALWPTSGTSAATSGDNAVVAAGSWLTPGDAVRPVDGDVPINAPPVVWTGVDRDDQVDNPQQWARQSGSRRYQ